MTRRNLALAAGALLLLVATFFAGMYSRPAKEVEVARYIHSTQLVYVWAEHAQAEQQVKWKERIVTVEVVRPDGSRETRKDETRGADVDTVATYDASGSQASTTVTADERTKTTENKRPDWSLAVGAQWSKVQPKPDTYDAELARRIAGTVWLATTATKTEGERPAFGVRARLEW